MEKALKKRDAKEGKQNLERNEGMKFEEVKKEPGRGMTRTFRGPTS